MKCFTKASSSLLFISPNGRASRDASLLGSSRFFRPTSIGIDKAAAGKTAANAIILLGIRKEGNDPIDGKEPRDGNPKRRSAFVGTTAFRVVDVVVGPAVVVSSAFDLKAGISATTNRKTVENT